ncbi:MAG: hypothetical protein Q4C52_04825 [Eubacteriales bacterium]|nr:hypothetical protein [Eubacteriales bacterium]
MKNQEGYYDPTAERAIRRASRKRRNTAKYRTLTYKLGEMPEFRRLQKIISF